MNSDKGIKKNLRAKHTTETENRVKGGLLLIVVAGGYVHPQVACRKSNVAGQGECPPCLKS